MGGSSHGLDFYVGNRPRNSVSRRASNPAADTMEAQMHVYTNPASGGHSHGAAHMDGHALSHVASESAAPGPDESRYEQAVVQFLSRYAISQAHSSRELWAALDAACDALAATGATSEPQAKLLRDCVSRDIAQLASVLVRGHRREAGAIARLAQQRGPLRLLVEALRLSGDAIYRLAGESGRVELRRAGEVTCAGTLSCAQCGATHRSTQSLLVVSCVECGAAEHVKALHV
jgi:hypothetical protein